MLISEIKMWIRFLNESLFSLHYSLLSSSFSPSSLLAVPLILFLSLHLSPISFSQVVQVLRAIDRDEGGNDSAVHFKIPPDSNVALNFSIRESGGLQSLPQFVSPTQPCASVSLLIR